jgi:hypothetical protein
MPTLETLANYAEIAGAAAVMFAIGFAILEFRQLRIQRQEQASLEMMRAWQSPQYVNAVYNVLRMDDHIDPAILRDLDEESEKGAFQVCMTMEAVGVMVHRGTLPIEIVNDLMGGAVCTTWRKLDFWAQEFRSAHNPRAFEWHEWLAAQLENMPLPQAVDTRFRSD